MFIETTQKVDPEIAQDLLNGQSQMPGFIFGYVKLGLTQVEMVTVVHCANGERQRGQREVRAIQVTEDAETYYDGDS